MFRERFWLSVLLTIPVLVWSEMVQAWLGFTAPTFPLSARSRRSSEPSSSCTGHAVPAGRVREIRDRRPGMMLLISLAILVAFVASLASEFGVLDLEFWWELALLIDVMLLGHWQEMRALGQASSALEALAALLPDEAELIHDDMTHTVPVAELRPGDLVLVRPAEGAGGRDDRGRGRRVRRVDDHGGVQPVGHGRAIASWPARWRPTARSGSGSTPSATTRRSRASSASSWSAGVAFEAQALADRAAAILFYVAVTAGALTFVVWSAIGETGEARRACRHRARDLVPARARARDPAGDRDLHRCRRSSRDPGQGPPRLERMRTVDAVLFDKTGTLTRGTPVVREVVGVGVPRERSCAGRRRGSEQRAPARARRSSRQRGRTARSRRVGVPSTAGRGVGGVVGGDDVEVGGPACCASASSGSPRSRRRDGDVAGSGRDGADRSA
jgi:Cu2+-exporting ATPase